MTRIIIVFSLLSYLSFSGFTQAIENDTLYYSLEEKDFIRKPPVYYSVYKIRTYHNKKKKDYSVQLINLELNSLAEFEVLNNKKHGAYSYQLPNKLETEGSYYKDRKVGSWTTRYIEQKITVNRTYDKNGRIVDKSVSLPNTVKFYEDSDLNFKINNNIDFASVFEYFEKQNFIQEHQSIKADLKVKILEDGTVVNVEPLNISGNLFPIQIEKIVKYIFLLDLFLPGFLNNEPVNSTAYLTLELRKTLKKTKPRYNIKFWYPSDDSNSNQEKQ